jgi:transcriptional regulator of acetoin/glycerol metabolism
MIPETDMHDLKSLARAARGGTLDPLRLAEKAWQMGSAACHKAVAPPPPPETLNLAEIEKATIKKAIETTGNIVAAAHILGIGKTTAYRKAKEYGILIRAVPTTCPNCGEPLLTSQTLSVAA